MKSAAGGQGSGAGDQGAGIGGQDLGIRAVLLDIEGTTTPIAFVHDILFPYARARMQAYLATSAGNPEVEPILHDLRAEHAREREAAGVDGDVAYLHWLMDRDRKSGPLKALQGLIWAQGYADGTLTSEVYPDVPPALARWTAAGIAVGIFSSGSVLAQKLLFAHTRAGDLTPSLRWHFDTAVGAKGDAASYRRIVAAMGVPAAQIMFVSDIVGELDAARTAGLQTRLAVRPPAEAPAVSAHPMVRSFDEISG